VTDPVQDAVVVESEADLPPKNITVAEFPAQEAEPPVQVDEDQDGLGMVLLLGISRRFVNRKSNL